MTRHQFAFGFAAIIAFAIVGIVGLSVGSERAFHWSCGAAVGTSIGRLIWERLDGDQS